MASHMPNTSPSGDTYIDCEWNDEDNDDRTNFGIFWQNGIRHL